MTNQADTPAMEEIRLALWSTNESQRLIAEHGLAWTLMLLRKNADYGDSAFTVPSLAPQLPATTAILVRMTDKIMRLQSLAKSGEAKVAESFDDTVMDLGAYCLLYQAAKARRP